MPGGRLCIAMGHPVQGVGDHGDHGYLVTRSYFEPRRLTYWSDRAGRRVAFNFVHRPLSAYTEALAAAGFVIERLLEPGHDRLVPYLVHIRATKVARPSERLYVVVSGPPASGKSTLAPQLAQRLGLPLIAKDTIKDALMTVLPVPDPHASRQLGAAAVRAMLAVAAESPVGAVIESHFARSRSAAEVLALPGRVIEVQALAVFGSTPVDAGILGAVAGVEEAEAALSELDRFGIVETKRWGYRLRAMTVEELAAKADLDE